MKKKMVSLVALVLSLSMLAGCGENSQDLMSGVIANTLEVKSVSELTESGNAAADFGVNLFQHCLDSEGNTLISPISVLYALAMTANGAAGDTKAEMEAVLGLDTDTLNEYLLAYREGLGENGTLHLANAIWFRDSDSFVVNDDFLQTNADYYGASIYQAPFDESTISDINSWVKEQTDGMIPEIVESIYPKSIMFLVNALAFEADWQAMYDETQVHEDTFTLENGSTQTADFMYGKEYTYLEDDLATGFVKYYEGCDYAFVALLPNEGVSVQDYVASLTGAHLVSLLENAQSETVYTALPKFETEYSADLSDVLADMGMPLAFDGGLADFSNLGAMTDGNNIYISSVIHKTFISVAEQGTRAGAATVVAVEATGALAEEPKQVYLTRPFVYMIIDCESNLPLFIGTMMDLEG